MDNAAGFDIHAHFYPQAYLDLIAKDGARFGASYDLAEGDRPVITVGALHAGPLAREFTELEPRLAEMDRQGVEMQALSLTQPMVYWADGKFGLELAQAFNDALAEAPEAHDPSSFSLRGRRLHRAQQEGVPESDPLQSSSQNPSLQTLQVDDDVGEFGHQSTPASKNCRNTETMSGL